MYGYIYETTNLINGKKYIGKHKSTKFESTKYLGSGKALNNAIAKYGKKNFVVNLIEECETEEQLSEREIFWIDYYNAVENDNYYNIIPDSSGGDLIKFLPLEQQQKIHKDHSEMMKTFRHTEESKQKMAEQRKGHKVSDETKQKISASNKGKRLGRKETQEVREKHRLARLNHKQPEETKQKISQSNKGKRLGCKASPESIRKQQKTYKRIKLKWMQNGIKAIRVKEVDYQTYLDMGYKFGRKVI